MDLLYVILAWQESDINEGNGNMLCTSNSSIDISKRNEKKRANDRES